MEEILQKAVYMYHKRLCTLNDELIDARYRVGSDLGTRMFKELKELWNQNVQGAIQSVRI